MAKLKKKKKKGSYNGQVEEGQEINGSKPGALKGSQAPNSMGISDRVLGYLPMAAKAQYREVNER